MDKYHNPKTYLNIFSLTHSSSSYSSSSFDTILVMFMHSFPLQSPSEATHFIPIAWQEHLPWKSRWWVVCGVHTFFSPTFPTRGYTFQSYCTATTFTMKWKSRCWVVCHQQLALGNQRFIPQSISSKCFCVFLNNRTFFHLGIAESFFFPNSIEVGVACFSFAVLELERPGLVRKCDDYLIFSANECFLLSILVDLLL